jgi:UDP-glucose 4-epimerase
MNNEGVLVLGSAGFIGAAIVDRLIRLDCHVYAVGHTEATEENGRLMRIRGSIEDDELLKEVLPHCRHIVYAAGRTTPGTSARDPSLEVTDNLFSLTRLLSCLANFPGRRLVYLSSAGAIYGDLARGVDESSVLRPRSYYGAGKVAAEAFIHVCAISGNTDAVVLRPTNLYGPQQPVSKGFAIIPTLFQRAIDGKPFQIWGDGSAVRDYCYIDDLIEVIVRVLSHPAKSGFAAFNVAGGHTASILELIAACERVSGRKIHVEFHPSRGVDVAHVSPQVKAIRDSYGWQPAISLDEGLGLTWEWFRTKTMASQTMHTRG